MYPTADFFSNTLTISLQAFFGLHLFKNTCAGALAHLSIAMAMNVNTLAEMAHGAMN